VGLLNGSSWGYKNVSLGVGLWASCCFALGNTIRFKESGFAKGFKFQRLQWLNDGRVRRFAHDSSESPVKY
jgi:hypothetical protein